MYMTKHCAENSGCLMKHMRTHITSQHTYRPAFSAMLAERARVSLWSHNERVQCQCGTRWERKSARVPCSPDESPHIPEKYHLGSRRCSCHKTIYLSFLYFMQSFFLFHHVFFICLLHLPLSLFPLNGWFCQACVRLLLTHFSQTYSLILCPPQGHTCLSGQWALSVPQKPFISLPGSRSSSVPNQNIRSSCTFSDPPFPITMAAPRESPHNPSL